MVRRLLGLDTRSQALLQWKHLWLVSGFVDNEDEGEDEEEDDNHGSWALMSFARNSGFPQVIMELDWPTLHECSCWNAPW